MTETAATPPLDHPSTSTEPLLVRPTEGRILGGVCAGVARRFGLDVTLVRILAVVLTLASGVGAALYLAVWLLTPSSDGPAPLQPESPLARTASRFVGRVGRSAPAVIVVVLACLVLAGVTHSFWLGAPIGVVIALILLAAVVGSRRGRWLLGGTAAVLAVGLATVGVFGSHFGTRTYAVSSISDLASTYEYGAGRIRLDLSALESVTGRHSTDVRLGRGDVTITVPSGLPVIVKARVGAGSVTVDGHEVSGVDAEQTRTIGNATSTSDDRLVVDVTVAVGSVVVRTK